MMNKRIKQFLFFFAIASVMLTGCMREAKSDTFIIPDTAEEQSPADENELFAVKTIYRVLDKTGDDFNAMGWIDRQTIVGLLGEQSGTPSFERIDYPYDSRLKLKEADELSGLTGLSPDGRYLFTVAAEEEGHALKLVSLSDQREKNVGEIAAGQIRSIRSGWSNNSRFLIYSVHDQETGGVKIVAYDSTSGKSKGYSVSDWPKKDVITGIHIADDGQSAAIVRESSDQSDIVFGTWSGSEFTSQYEHTVGSESGVEWMHDDQIAFVGPEGSLYAYDRRNAALSVLLERIDTFKISLDRKYIAYTQGADTVYAAVLYGNNVINKKQLYRGIIPSRMAWSPDNGKLLLSGWKPYARGTQPRPAVVPPYNQNLVIEFE